jgi:hypothetical protein
MVSTASRAWVEVLRISRNPIKRGRTLAGVGGECLILDFGPLRPAPAHSQMSLHDGLNFRLRGGIGCWIVGRCEWGKGVKGLGG